MAATILNCTVRIYVFHRIQTRWRSRAFEYLCHLICVYHYVHSPPNPLSSFAEKNTNSFIATAASATPWGGWYISKVNSRWHGPERGDFIAQTIAVALTEILHKNVTEFSMSILCHLHITYAFWGDPNIGRFIFLLPLLYMYSRWPLNLVKKCSDKLMSKLTHLSTRTNNPSFVIMMVAIQD